MEMTEKGKGDRSERKRAITMRKANRSPWISTRTTARKNLLNSRSTMMSKKKRQSPPSMMSKEERKAKVKILTIKKLQAAK